MKRILFYSLLAVLVVTLFGVVPSQAQYNVKIPVSAFKKSGNGFVLVGNIEGVNGQVYMTEAGVPNARVLDSTVAVNGRFSFKGELAVPVMVNLVIPGQIAFTPFFIENSEMMVYGRRNNREVDVYGSITDNKYRERNRMVREILEKRLDNRDMFGEVTSDINRLNLAFVDNNLNSVVSAFILFSELANSLPLQALKFKIESFSDVVKKSIYVRELMTHVEAVEATSIGKKYVDVSAPDAAGNVRKLSDLVGDGYVLLNFWGSWCGPCRVNNKIMQQIEKEYSSYGLKIFNVAIDRDYNEWVNAMRREPVGGVNVSSLKLWNCPIAKAYGVNSVPMMLLIDPKGNIVVRGANIVEMRALLNNVYRKNISSVIVVN